MEIIFICNEYPPAKAGGIGIFTKELAEAISEDDNNKVIVYGQYFQEDDISVEVDGNIEVYRRKKYKGLLGYIYNSWLLRKDINNITKKNNIDILECPDFTGQLLYINTKKITTVVRLHGSVSYFLDLQGIKSWKSLFWYFVERLALIKSDHIVSVSKFTSRHTNKIFKLNKKIDVIYNGVKIPPVIGSNIKEDRNKFLYVGSIIRKKGIIELIDAWCEFQKDKPGVRLDIYGKDIEDLTVYLKSILSTNGVENVIFHGAVPKEELNYAYQNAGACIFPTKAEAFSLAPMEAMASGKIVMYSNQTSAKELITDLVNGILIDRCSVKEIVKCLNQCYHLEKEERNKISNNARETIIDKFDVKNKARENIVYFQRLQ